jgi:hypothetical protein
MSNTNAQTNPTNPSFWQQLGAYITPQGLVSALVFVVAFVGVGYLIDAVFKHLGAGWGLPVLALSGVLLLLGALLIFTTLIHLIGLSDATSALGLPDGSVRALLALALLGLFAILASSVLVGSPPREVKGLLVSDIDEVKKANPDERDIFWIPEKHADLAQPQTFTATFGSATRVDDFGKQMLTLVGTLMTAVISFYFGSATTQSATGIATAPSSTGTTSAPSSTGTTTIPPSTEPAPGNGPSGPTTEANPSTFSPTTAKTAASQSYSIKGTGLGSVTKVDALPPGGGASVPATNLRAADTEVTFDLSLPSVGKWTLQTTSGAAAPVSAPGTVEVSDV